MDFIGKEIVYRNRELKGKDYQREKIIFNSKDCLNGVGCLSGVGCLNGMDEWYGLFEWYGLMVCIVTGKQIGRAHV